MDNTITKLLPFHYAIAIEEEQFQSDNNKYRIHLKDHNRKTIGCPLNGHTSYVRQILQLRDGRIASCADDRKIIIWQNVKGIYEDVLIFTDAHTDNITMLLEMFDERLASASIDLKVKIWDVNSLKQKNPIVIGFPTNVIDMLEVKGYLIFTPRVGPITLWDVKKEVVSFMSNRNEGQAIAEISETQIIMAFPHSIKILNFNSPSLHDLYESAFICKIELGFVVSVIVIDEGETIVIFNRLAVITILKWNKEAKTLQSKEHITFGGSSINKVVKITDERIVCIRKKDMVIFNPKTKTHFVIDQILLTELPYQILPLTTKKIIVDFWELLKKWQQLQKLQTCKIWESWKKLKIGKIDNDNNFEKWKKLTKSQNWKFDICFIILRIYILMNTVSFFL